jgi:deoxyribodipyrimidine photolyase-related protein
VKELTLIFPHQLFKDHPALKKGRDVVIIEDPLFFGDYKYPLKYHKMKLTFHRASMKYYEEYLIQSSYNVFYINYRNLKSDRNFLFSWISKNKYKAIHLTDPDDYILLKRLTQGADKYGIRLINYHNPSFLNDEDYLRLYFKSKKKYFQHYFYTEQRKKYNIMIDNGKPRGGKWSYDFENRKPFPPKMSVPGLVSFKNESSNIDSSKLYVNENFPENPGSYDNFYLPISHSSAQRWLEDFLELKLSNFGNYQDAIVKNESFLFHSLLSPMLNSGLLTPDYVIQKSLEFAEINSVPLNSIEGFVRQIIGWREFIRAVYLIDGVKQRNSNFWKNEREMPGSFYSGTTGIDPIDNTIIKLLQTGYSHHIERLMILGNFMLLCEIQPTEVYNWFMEMYVDAYDWVMVPNVYGMSQFSDGGLMSTKPYISSSNYILKMSDYKSGNWTEIWDALYWRFIFKHQDYFMNNNRTVFVARNLNKMSAEKLKSHIETAENFLQKL